MSGGILLWMRVAYFISRFPKITETFILQEMLELERRDVDIELFALHHEREGVVHPEAGPLERAAHYANEHSMACLLAQASWLAEAPVPYLRTWGQVIAAHWRSPRLLLKAAVTTAVGAMWARDVRAAGCDRVHAHWATWPSLAAWVVHQLVAMPYSITAHAHDLYLDRTMLADKIVGADFVATVSEFNRRLIENEYGPGAARKTYVVRCGVDTAGFHAGAVRTERDGPFEIVCVGALEDYKGQRFLLEACARLRERQHAVRCVVVGEGPQRPALEALIAELGLEGLVELVGRRPAADVRSFLCRADAVVLPSIVTRAGKTEGLPVALIEALAAERPVVATAVAGVSELVEDGVTGLLVPPGDAAALTDALERLVADPLLGARLAHAGRGRVLAEFGLAENVERLRGLLIASEVP